MMIWQEKATREDGLIIKWHLASFPLSQYNRPYQA